MKRRKVLIVCMLDSIHSAHWIERVKDSEIDFELFPSKIHRRIHPKIIEILQESPNVRLACSHNQFIFHFHGYLDYIIERVHVKQRERKVRAERLDKIIRAKKFDFIHALEIQGAGYLCGEIVIPEQTQLITTNWGSDIYYFMSDEAHEKRIRELLQKTDRYSAECIRDYYLARDLGFKGMELPVIPNSGGNYQFDVGVNPVKQDLVVVKTYGGIFGRGDLAVNAIEKLLEDRSSYEVFFYSVGDANLSLVKNIQKRFPSRIRYSTVRHGISHTALMKEFMRAKIYLGCSESDGISTSFLEAISNRVYPMQTDTSCANEWTKKGITASLIPLDQEKITNELLRVAQIWDTLVDKVETNFQIAKVELDRNFISEVSKGFYSD